MSEYLVTFTKHLEYWVSANNEDEAEQVAYKEFKRDRETAISDNIYDEVDIEELENEE